MGIESEYRRNSWLFVPLLILLIISSCSNSPMDIVSEFEKLFDGKFRADEPGGVILVKKNDETIFLKSYGLADMTTREAISPATIFNTGSISKTFVAYGILLLQEAGLLSIDDGLDQYFDNFDHPEIARKVKIRHLLTHTSGLPDSRKVSEEFEYYLTAKDEENFEPILHTEALKFEPGSRFDYSNPAFNGLALIIQKVTGRKWQSFIREKIFERSGMNHSEITDGSFPEDGVAHGYIRENDSFTELDYGEEPTFAAAGNGGVWSSVEDLARYEAEIQRAGFLNKSLIERSRLVQHPENWNSEKHPEVGLSWFVAEADHPGNAFDVKIISHTGWQGGFRGFMVSVPEKDLLYIGLFNRPVPDLSESYNPFTSSGENASDVRIKGLQILRRFDWLEE